MGTAGQSDVTMPATQEIAGGAWTRLLYEIRDSRERFLLCVRRTPIHAPRCIAICLDMMSRWLSMHSILVIGSR
jgi:hypothetical protein